MSVVAWDGKTLAADRQGTHGDFPGEYPKSRKIQQGIHYGHVVAWTGDLDRCEALARWYEEGANIEKLPQFQKSEDWCQLIVADSKSVKWYQREGIYFYANTPFMAWGCGRDLAIGAMAHGASAEEAVKIAINHNIYCGFGVDKYDLIS